jgi:hypothetical protein
MLSEKCVALAICVVGCSSSSAGSPADAMAPTPGTKTTTTGGGGGGGGVPSAQGALSLYLTSVANPMPVVTCPAGAHWINVPFAALGGQQTTATTKGSSAVDGVDQIAVTCAVKEASGVFAVSASLRSPALDPATGSPVNPTLVTLSTSIAAGQMAMGLLTVQDNKTATSFSSVNDTGMPEQTCTFSVEPLLPTDQVAVAPGRIWASVTCRKIRDPESLNLNEMCAIATGYVVLENCDQ